MTEQHNYEAKREELRRQFLAESETVPEPPGTGGVHHLALICSDIEETIRFYTEVVNMRLTRIIQNRDEPSSTHIFLDMGGGNLLAFFDFPQRGSDATARGIGSMHHVAIKAKPEAYQAILANLKQSGIPYDIHGTEEQGSLYFRDPDNILIEINTNPQ